MTRHARLKARVGVMSPVCLARMMTVTNIPLSWLDDYPEVVLAIAKRSGGLTAVVHRDGVEVMRFDYPVSRLGL